MGEVLTSRQREILDYLRQMLRDKAYPPTVREIGQAIGLSSSSTVQNHLNTLERKGYIHRDPAKSRAIELVDKRAERRGAGARVTSLPIVGQVAAGSPILAEENIEDRLDVSVDLFGDDAFLLRVRGDSMIDAGILDGDLVAVRPGRDAPNGSIVVAVVPNGQTGEQEATVKRLFRERDAVRLQPENSRFEPLVVRDLKVEGVVVGVLRVAPRGL